MISTFRTNFHMTLEMQLARVIELDYSCLPVSQGIAVFAFAGPASTDCDDDEDRQINSNIFGCKHDSTPLLIRLQNS